MLHVTESAELTMLSIYLSDWINHFTGLPLFLFRWLIIAYLAGSKFSN
jgi:hypothetical protein